MRFLKTIDLDKLRQTLPGTFEIWIILKFSEILQKEGFRGLWKGVGPNLVGVAPSRAIHFATYQGTKRFLTEQCAFPESDFVNLSSAVFAGTDFRLIMIQFQKGISVATVTAPIWLVKTRMQLQRDEKGKVSSFFRHLFNFTRERATTTKIH